MEIMGTDHVAIIASDYEVSKRFYSEILGFEIIREEYRKERDSHMLHLALKDGTQIELFSFPNPPARVTDPEACGLRHLAFKVKDIAAATSDLQSKGVEIEEIRTDEATKKRFTFFRDPDGLPLELCEI